MGACSRFGESYLKWVNGVTILISLVVLALGVYALVENEFSQTIPGFSLDFSRFAGVGILVFGLFILLLSTLGCFAAKADSHCFALIYNFLMFVFWLILLVSGVLLLVYAGVFDDISVVDSAELTDGIKIQINDAQLALYQGCCAEKYDTSAVLSCAVDPCTDDDSALCTCYKDEEIFEDYLSQAFNVSEVCEFAEKITVKGNPLVGEPSQGSCGGGDPKVFQQDVAYLVSNYALGISIGVLVLSAILFFAMVFGCVIFCNVAEEKKKKQKKKEGADLTGTAPTGASATQYV